MQPSGREFPEKKSCQVCGAMLSKLLEREFLSQFRPARRASKKEYSPLRYQLTRTLCETQCKT